VGKDSWIWFRLEFERGGGEVNGVVDMVEDVGTVGLLSERQKTIARNMPNRHRRFGRLPEGTSKEP